MTEATTSSAERADEAAAVAPPPMSGPAKSIFYFAWYMVAVGTLLLLFPSVPFALLPMLPEEGLTWVRVLGMLVLVFSYYYINLARAGMTQFFRWTVHTRCLVPVVFGALILTGNMHPILMLFALGDFAGGLWTAAALHRDGIKVLW